MLVYVCCLYEQMAKPEITFLLYVFISIYSNKQDIISKQTTMYEQRELRTQTFKAKSYEKLLLYEINNLKLLKQTT